MRGRRHAASLGLLPIVWIGSILSVLQQFVGINVIFYYSSVLWQAVGFDESDSLLISTITGVVNIGTTILAISLIDKVGRRPLLLFGSGGMTVCLLALTALFSTASENSAGDPTLDGAAGLPRCPPRTGSCSSSASRGPARLGAARRDVPEPDPGRQHCPSRPAAQWAANFIVSATFPSLAAISLGLAYGLYTAFAAISFVFVQRAIVETKGSTLEGALGGQLLLSLPWAERSARSGAEPAHHPSADQQADDGDRDRGDRPRRRPTSRRTARRTAPARRRPRRSAG